MLRRVAKALSAKVRVVLEPADATPGIVSPREVHFDE
jgi:hypothetical protein